MPKKRMKHQTPNVIWLKGCPVSFSIFQPYLQRNTGAGNMRVYFRENKIGKVNGKVDLLPQCSKPISKCNLKEVHVELQIFQYWKETMQSSIETSSISERWIWNPALSNQQKALSMFVHENICKMKANIGEQHQKHVLTCKAIMNRGMQSSTKTISQQKQAWLITSKN